MVRPAAQPSPTHDSIPVVASPKPLARQIRPMHLRAIPRQDRYLGKVAFDSTSLTDLPPPAPGFIQRLALFAFEVVEGTRSAAQLGGWILPDVAAQLMERRASRVERRTLYNDHRRIVSAPGPVHLDRPAPHTVEATVVLYAEPTSTSVALRLEHLRGRWRVTDLTVL